MDICVPSSLYLSTLITPVLDWKNLGLVPVSFLPHPVSDVANVLPFTEFMRASRQAMIYGDMQSYFSYIGLAVLGGVTVLALGFVAFRYAENRARRLGVIDKKTA